MKFSERMGIDENIIQIKSIDEGLKTRLWNVFFQYIDNLDVVKRGKTLQKIFTDLMKAPLDEFPKKPKKPKGKRIVYSGYNRSKSYKNNDVIKYEDELLPEYEKELVDYKDEISNYFFECKWNEVYDFLEFFVANIEGKNQKVIAEFNDVLKEENSAYRFIGEVIDENINEIEIKEIDLALTSPIGSVKTHIDQALKLLSNRKNPDYRNSMKESILAVEAVCCLIVKKANATLGDALKIIEKRNVIKLHPAQKEAFSKLYGYTNDANGIRHHLKDKSKINSADARYFLVIYSAFVNYLIGLANDSGIEL